LHSDRSLQERLRQRVTFDELESWTPFRQLCSPLLRHPAFWRAGILKPTSPSLLKPKHWSSSLFNQSRILRCSPALLRQFITFHFPSYYSRRAIHTLDFRPTCPSSIPCPILWVIRLSFQHSSNKWSSSLSICGPPWTRSDAILHDISRLSIPIYLHRLRLLNGSLQTLTTKHCRTHYGQVSERAFRLVGCFLIFLYQTTHFFLTTLLGAPPRFARSRSVPVFQHTTHTPCAQLRLSQRTHAAALTFLTQRRLRVSPFTKLSSHIQSLTLITTSPHHYLWHQYKPSDPPSFTTHKLTPLHAAPSAQRPPTSPLTLSRSLAHTPPTQPPPSPHIGPTTSRPSRTLSFPSLSHTTLFTAHIQHPPPLARLTWPARPLSSM